MTRPLMTSCGETSERTAAMWHGVVAGLYLVMLGWHLKSVFSHLSRQ